MPIAEKHTPKNPFLDLANGLITRAITTPERQNGHEWAAQIALYVRDLYGGSPLQVRAALCSADRCADDRASRAELREDLDGLLYPGFLDNLADESRSRKRREAVRELLRAAPASSAEIASDTADMFCLAACAISEAVREHWRCANEFGRSAETEPRLPIAEFLTDLLRACEALPRSRSADVDAADLPEGAPGRDPNLRPTTVAEETDVQPLAQAAQDAILENGGGGRGVMRKSIVRTNGC